MENTKQIPSAKEFFQKVAKEKGMTLNVIKLLEQYSKIVSIYHLEAMVEEIKEKESISQELLAKELEDKRIVKLSNLPKDIYYLHRKQTAEYLLDKYFIIDKQSISDTATQYINKIK